MAAPRIDATWEAFIAEQMAREFWYHFYLHVARQLLELVGDVRGIRTADVGCTPAVSVLLARRGARVTLVDIDRRELDKAGHFAAQVHATSGLHRVQADLFALPFLDRPFDLVWNSGVVEHFPDPAAVIRQMVGITRPGGRVVVLVPRLWTLHSMLWRPLARLRREFYWDYMGRERSFTAAQLRATMERAGLKVERIAAANVRRSVLDDYVVALLRLDRRPLQRLLHGGMALCDGVERLLPFVGRLGFMIGAVGRTG